MKKSLIFQLLPNFDGPTVLTKFGILFLRAPTSAKYLWMSQRIDKFSSANKASEACGISKKTVLHNVNYSFTKCVYLGVARPLLFVRNTNAPILSHVPVILIDTLNNVAYSYPSPFFSI